MFLGLLMVAHENDILEAVIARHEEIVDGFYALDGTAPNDESRAICERSKKCLGYTADVDLPRPPYPVGTTCGYRNWPLQQAIADHGWDHWFLELHGDEVWTFDPREVVAAHPDADGFVFRLPFYFPRDGEPWDDNRHPFDQLTWHMLPGWPEFRMFHGNEEISFDPDQHFDTRPSGIRNVAWPDKTIKHYPYRSPASQRDRAAHQQKAGLDPDNYQHITDRDAVYWTGAMIADAHCEHHYIVARDGL